MASLLEQQRSFAAAVRDPASACAVLPPGNLAVYRNNAAIGFRSALQRTFPVLRRRVGDDYFRQLATFYRERFPSRSGDLHWAGRDFAAFLDGHLGGGDYAWLADLARLEWSRHECSVAAAATSLSPGVLAEFAPQDLEHLVFSLQPSLRMHSSSYPVFSVWQANQVDNAPPVDQSLGAECWIIHSRDDRVAVRLLDRPRFSFLSALSAGAELGEAMTRGELDEDGLSGALAFVFNEGLVCSVAV